MWILIALLVLVVVIAVVALTSRSRGPAREPDWPGAHDTSARDHHFSGGGYGGGGSESGPGSSAGP